LKKYLFILFLLCIFNIDAQTYNYSYTDPCTGNLKTIVVPINGNVTVAYYGELGSFNANDFTNGNFESWASGIFNQYGQDSPCSQIVGLGTAINVTQSTTLNVMGILNSLSTIASLTSGATNILGGAVGSVSNSSGDGESNNNDNNKNNNGNSNVSNNSSNSSGSGSSVPNQSNQSSQTQSGGTQEGSGTSSSETSGNPEGSSGSGSTSSPEGSGGNTSSESGSSGTESGGTSSDPGSGSSSGGSTSGTSGNGNGGQTSSNQEGSQTTSEKTEGKTNITAGASTTVKSSPTSKEGGKPSVVASSDFVGFNFRNSDVKLGAKATGGYTAMRWDGQRSWGALADYTSALKGPNITCFYAWMKPKSVILLSGTVTIGFEGNKSLYGTIAFGQMFKFKKAPTLKVVYMATASYGQVYRVAFTGTAVIGGIMYDIKVGKRIDIKLMNLMVYAPYVSYYNDVLLKSPYVMLPSIGTNIGITKKFKFNINAGGAWDLKTAALNYTVTCGTRILVGQ
jgi:hypothetical protein